MTHLLEWEQSVAPSSSDTITVRWPSRPAEMSPKAETAAESILGDREWPVEVSADEAQQVRSKYQSLTGGSDATTTTS